VIIGTIAIVVATVVLGMLITRKRGFLVQRDELVKPRPKQPSHAAGEAPATAIRAAGDQHARLRKAQRCHQCRAVLTPDAGEHVRYGDGELLVIELRCARCGTKRALYVNDTSPR
jgi:hypothetical protein